MRPVRTLAFVCALFGLLLQAVPAAADDSSVEDRLRALEEELAETREQLGQANQKLETVAPDVGQGSGVDAFFSSLEVGGYVSASYIYNFNHSAAVANFQQPGPSQPLCQFNCAQNQFTLDAVKFELGKSVPQPGDAGFQFDLLFGQNADILQALSPDSGASFAAGLSDLDGSFNGASDFDPFIQQAYVAYNFRGIELKAGKFETLLGWEVLDQPDNYNITQGILFTWAIPLYHTGVLASGSFNENLGWAAGVANGFNNSVENNQQKAFLGQLNYTEGDFFTSLSSYYGDGTGQPQSGTSQPGSTDSLFILDYVASLQASEDVILWLNADWGRQEDGAFDTAGNPSNGQYYGVSVGGNMEVNERTNVALRGEYFKDDSNVRGAVPANNLNTTALTFNRSADVEIYSLTGTVKYNVTNQLILGGEVRWDAMNNDYHAPNFGNSGNIFPGSSTGRYDNDEIFGLVNVTYEFD